MKDQTGNRKKYCNLKPHRKQQKGTAIKIKSDKHTLMATKLGEFSTSIGALGKNWASPSVLASN
jgi:hypothetical protein